MLLVFGSLVFLPEWSAPIEEAKVVAERSEGRWWCAEMHRLRGVFLATLGANEAQIEVSLCAAIRTAKEQKSVSLAARAEATYTEYRRQKRRAQVHGFQRVVLSGALSLACL